MEPHPLGVVFRAGILLFANCFYHTLDILAVRTQLLALILRVGHNMVKPLNAEYKGVPEAYTLPHIKPVVPELKFFRQ